MSVGWCVPQGPWTEAEDAQLRKLQAEKGNRWKEIGGVLGRHPEGVADRWNNLGKGVVRQMGEWVFFARSNRLGL